MKKSLFCILFLSFVISSYGENDKKYWKRWNTNYPKVDILLVLESERLYADSVEKNPEMIQYYVRKGAYRFDAEYLGKTRDVSNEVFSSMKRVFKLLLGDPKQLDGMVEKEVLFRVGKEEIWMPIQPNVLRALEEEIEKGTTITLYCLFFNEHSYDNFLCNTLFISEFHQQWIKEKK